MSNILEGVLNAIAPAAEPILAGKLAELFRKIQPAATRKEILIELNSAAKLLQPITDKTSTRIDDLAIDSLRDAINIVSSEDNITFPS